MSNIIHVGDYGRYVQVKATNIELEQLPTEFQKLILDTIQEGTPEGFETKKLKVQFWAEAYVEKLTVVSKEEMKEK